MAWVSLVVEEPTSDMGPRRRSEAGRIRGQRRRDQYFIRITARCGPAIDSRHQPNNRSKVDLEAIVVTVLALGLDPKFADLTSMPGLTPDLVRAFIDSQLERIRSLGYEVESCLVDLGETAEEVLKDSLSKRAYDCVMIGAGLRAPEGLLLFEKLLNMVHARAPRAKICFNTTPADSAEAVQRWV
jgi:hypothetical protein